jgi:hypothetical protein
MMRFKYKSIRILGEETVGSGPGYIMRQARYDLKSVQDHEVEVPLSLVFFDTVNIGCAGLLAILVSIPVGIVSLIALFDKLPGAGSIATTFGVIFTICAVLFYPIFCFKEIRPAAVAAVRKQRNPGPNEQIRVIPTEDWEAFLRETQATTASAQAQQSRFDAVERHGNRPS